MQDHHEDPGVFIRSMASRGRLGGLAQATLEMALLFDAFGRDVVLIETVGVGQDEIEIARLADVTVLVLVPGLGDDIQAMKAGIMEIADLFAINKADQAGAERLEQEIRAMQSTGQNRGGFEGALIRRVVAREGLGVYELLGEIYSTYEKVGQKGSRAETWILRLREMVRDSLTASLDEQQLQLHAIRVANRAEDPYSAVFALRRALMEQKDTAV